VIKNLYIIFFGILLAQQFTWHDNGVALRQGVHIEWQKTGDIGNEGEMIFAWSDTRTSDREVYAQKFDSSGQKLWGTDGIIVASYEGRQEDPILIHDGNGGAYVIWRDYRVEPDPIGDVYAQHINSDGTLSYPSDGFALSNEEGYQVSLNMCSDGQGGAYAIWMDTGGKTYASHLTPDSSQIPNPGIGTVVLNHSWGYSKISLETAGSGDAMMVWFDERPEGGESEADVYAQRIGLDESGNIITKWSTPEEGGIPICTAEGKQEGAKVTYYNEDWNVVVWEDSRHNDYLAANGAPSTIDIYAQFIDANGNKADAYYDNGNPLVSNLCYDPSACTPSFPLVDQTNPRVKASDGGAFVIWIDKRNFNDDIYMQIITPENSAVLVGDSNLPFDGIPVTEAPNAQGSARLTTDGFGGAYIIWDDLQTPHYDLYVQHYNSSGVASFQEGGIFLSDADNNQISPLIRPDQYGGALAVWEDRKDGSISIYAQHIDSQLGITLQENGLSMYYGIDGNAFLYNDADPYKAKLKSLYLDNKNLVYWEDRRGGNIYINDNPFTTYYTYGTLVDNLGPAENKQLSNHFDQNFPDIKNLNDDFLLSFYGLDTTDIENKIFYQRFDSDMEILGGEATLVDPSLYTSQGANRSYATIVDNDGYTRFVYSRNAANQTGDDQQLFNEIFTKVNDPLGVEYEPVSTLYGNSSNFSMANLNDAYSSNSNCQFSDGGDCLLAIFEEEDVNNNTTLKVKAEADAPISLSIDGSNQQFKDAVKTVSPSVVTEEQLFIVWEESKNGNIDIFGQHIAFDGSIIGPTEGIAICVNSAEQKNPSIDYNSSLNEVMVCWDDRRNTDRDVYCASVGLDSYIVNEIPITAGKLQAQVNPYVKATLTDSYLVVWEESALSDNGDIFTGDPVYYYDILMQEVKSGETVYTSDVVVCDAFHDQRNPRIDMLTDSGDISYLIYWEDMRSSGKEDLTNLFSQQLKINDCSGSLGGGEGFPEDSCDCNGGTLDQCGICEGDGLTCYGCTDILACNYSSTAFLDDGSCTYSEDNYDCDGNWLDIDQSLPKEYQLYDNYPNPFNPTTNIKFDVPKFDYVEILVYNINGQVIKTLQSGNMAPGFYSISWDGLNDKGISMPSGIYFYSMSAADFNKKNKMVFIK